MQKKLFTFICDYDGGTYLLQVESYTLNDSIKEWASNIDLKLFNKSNNYQDDFMKELLEEEPICVENVQNVWCISSFLDDKLMLINIILTVPPAQ